MGKITDTGKIREACSFDDAIVLHQIEKGSHSLQIIFVAAFSSPAPPSPVLRPS